MFTISKLFDPIGYDNFLENYFEKKHLIIKRNDPSFFESLITLSDIDEVLFSQKLLAPGFRLVGAQRDVFPEKATYCLEDTNIIDPVKFVQGYQDGYTLAMAGMQNHHPSTRNFCFDLENYFGHPFQTNFYLTPENSQGFKPHWDSHDVIVLQISGKKKWQIYENTVELADKNLLFDPKGFDPGKIVDEFELSAGDLLYIPRGLTHDAYTTDSHSLHVTTGMLGFTWSQFINEALTRRTKLNASYRKFIPLGELWNKSGESYEALIDELLQDLKQELISKSGLARFELNKKSKQFRVNNGQLQQVMNLNEVNADSKFVVRQNIPYQIENDEDNVRINILNTFVEYPEFCLETVNDVVQTTTPKKISELNGDLDNDSKLMLVKKLVSEA